MRINKYLSECGVCSRREADILIEEREVTVNGEPAVTGMQINDGDTVCVKGRVVSLLHKKTYLAFNKPRGVVCTAQKNDRSNIIDYINYPVRITYAGRLDKDSEGLMLLTDDGDLIDALMTGRRGHEKEYLVTTVSDIDPYVLKSMEPGMHLDDINADTCPCRVIQTGKREFRIILTQGINRQIRRMCRQLGIRIKTLKRIRIENLKLGELKTGQYRKLTEEEISGLKAAAAGEKHGKN